MTKTAAEDRLAQLGIMKRGLSLEEAAAYVGLSPGPFLQQVALGRMPKPHQYGRRRVWDRIALDRALGDGSARHTQADPIMEAIHASKPP
jgi:hypothetical protein